MDSREYFYGILSKEEQEKVIKIDTIPELLNYCLNNFSTNPATEGTHGKTSFEELSEDVGKVRGFLKTRNIKKGTHIAILFPNNYNFVKFFLGITTYGCVAVPFSMTMEKTLLEETINKMDIELFIHDNSSEDIVYPLKDKMKNISFLSTNDISLSTYIDFENINKEDPAAIIFTGGTTGIPKGALLTHKALMQGAYNGIFATKGVFEKRYYALIPFTHIFGLVRSFLTPLYTGSLVYLCESMKNIFIDLPEAKPTTLVLVPALADMIYGVISTRGIRAVGGNLEVIVCGGAPVSPNFIYKFKDLKIDILPGYGLTETANLVSGSGNQLDKPESVGIPFENQEVKIVNNELYIKGDNLMTEYYNDPLENQKSFIDGWLKTGDLARFDEEGFLYIIGRVKNTIVLDNGENVYPEELESKLNKVPVIKDCLIYADKNKFDHEVIAVEILPDMKAFEAAEIIDVNYTIEKIIEDTNKELPSYKQIKKFTIRQEDFERSPSMNIIRKGN